MKVQVWLKKFLHSNSKHEAEVPATAGMCGNCIQWDFSHMFLGRRYSACDHGVIKDKHSYTLWDIRSVRELVAAKDCLVCSFFVGLLVDQAQISEVASPASQRRMDVHFHKCLLSKCCGVLKFRVVETKAIRGSRRCSSPHEDTAVTGHQRVTVLPELGSTLSSGRSLTDGRWGGKPVAPRCSLAEMSSWVRSCSEDLKGTHHGCGKGRFETYTLKKLRLIDVSTMRLVVKQLPIQYAALSYVWDSPDLDQFRLYQVDLETMSKRGALRKRWDRVPTTIRDAIKVCVGCKVPYLWVDALCLVQDAPNLSQDLEEMTQIYDAAFMTIIAACGDSSWSGLNGISTARPKTRRRVAVGDMALIEALPPLGADLENARWTQRSWIFQEHIFSRRSLIFLENRVVFQCKRGWIDETIDFDYCGRRLHQAKASGRLSLPATELSPSVGVGFDYLFFVECFCKLELTYDSDALNACKGTIAWLQKNGMRFFWATPTDYLIRGLDFEAEGLERRSDYPSWSWLGWRRAEISNTQADRKIKDTQKTVERGYQKYSRPTRYNVRLKALCDVHIPSLGSDRTPEPQRFAKLQLVAREWERLLVLQAPVLNNSNLKGALTSSHNAEGSDVRSQVLVHDRDRSGNIELVGLEEEYEIEHIKETVYVRCLAIKTDARGVSERIGVGQVELIIWQAAKVRDQTVYLV